MEFLSFLKRNPYVRFVLPLIFGIICSQIIPAKLAFVCIVVLVVFFVFLVFRLNESFKNSWVFGSIVSFFLFLFGAIWMQFHFQENQNVSSKELQYVATVVQTPQEKLKSYASLLKIKAVKNEEWQQANLNVITYFEKSEKSKTLKPGDKIVFLARLQAIKANSNPYTFNYAKYMATRHILFQTYIRSKNFKKIEGSKGVNLRTLTSKWQQVLVEKFKKYIVAENERGVISAMALGYKAELTPEVKDAYANAGAMHVLAVSGLHVGILYLMISFLFRPFRKSKTGRIFSTIAAILIIWLYASITGFSPSVMRAATMFSVFLIGDLFMRKKSIYNSIAASAFILLIVEPHLIYYVGFQLSYAAVISIVFFQPIFSGWMTMPNKILDIIWQLLTVSLAAQIGTFPLGLYYFNQFPIYFLLTNLVVIYGTMVLFIGGIFFLTISWIPAVAQMAGSFLERILYGFNQSVFFIDNLPATTIKGVINPTQLILFYVLIAAITIYFLHKYYRSLIVILSTFVLLAGSFSWKKINRKNQEIFIVHDIPKKTVFQYIKGDMAYLFADSVLNEKDILYNIYDGWLHYGIRHKEIIYLGKEKEVIGKNFYFNKYFANIENTEITFLKDISLKDSLLFEKIHFDYLIAGNNCKLEIENDANIRIPEIIIDRSMGYYQKKKLKTSLDRKNIPYYDVAEKGAFLKSIEKK